MTAVPAVTVLQLLNWISKLALHLAIIRNEHRKEILEMSCGFSLLQGRAIGFADHGIIRTEIQC